ncbi:MAG: hypothetical protein AAFY81_08085, partial [Pseudomonadota bacterium]
MKHTARILCAFSMAFAAPVWAQNQDVGEPLAEGGEVEALAIEGEERWREFDQQDRIGLVTLEWLGKLKFEVSETAI